MKSKLRLLIVALVLLLSAVIGPVQQALANAAPAPIPPSSGQTFVRIVTQIIQLPGGTPKSPPRTWTVYIKQIVQGGWSVGLPWYVAGSGWFVKVASYVRVPQVIVVPSNVWCMPIAGVPPPGCGY